MVLEQPTMDNGGVSRGRYLAVAFGCWQFNGTSMVYWRHFNNSKALKRPFFCLKKKVIWASNRDGQESFPYPVLCVLASIYQPVMPVLVFFGLHQPVLLVFASVHKPVMFVLSRVLHPVLIVLVLFSAHQWVLFVLSSINQPVLVLLILASDLALY